MRIIKDITLYKGASEVRLRLWEKEFVEYDDINETPVKRVRHEYVFEYILTSNGEYVSGDKYILRPIFKGREISPLEQFGEKVREWKRLGYKLKKEGT